MLDFLSDHFSNSNSFLIAEMVGVLIKEASAGKYGRWWNGNHGEEDSNSGCFTTQTSGASPEVYRGEQPGAQELIKLAKEEVKKARDHAPGCELGCLKRWVGLHVGISWFGKSKLQKWIGANSNFNYATGGVFILTAPIPILELPGGFGFDFQSDHFWSPEIFWATGRVCISHSNSKCQLPMPIPILNSSWQLPIPIPIPNSNSNCQLPTPIPNLNS